jgi:hypothetical protein
MQVLFVEFLLESSHKTIYWMIIVGDMSFYKSHPLLIGWRGLEKVSSGLFLNFQDLFLANFYLLYKDLWGCILLMPRILIETFQQLVPTHCQLTLINMQIH